jgi:hypothetical protein
MVNHGVGRITMAIDKRPQVLDFKVERIELSNLGSGTHVVGGCRAFGGWGGGGRGQQVWAKQAQLLPRGRDDGRYLLQRKQCSS